MKKLSNDALVDLGTKKRIDWIKEMHWPGQLIQIIDQVVWTKGVESGIMDNKLKEFRDSISGNDKDSFTNAIENLKSHLDKETRQKLIETFNELTSSDEYQGNLAVVQEDTDIIREYAKRKK